MQGKAKGEGKDKTRDAAKAKAPAKATTKAAGKASGKAAGKSTSADPAPPAAPKPAEQGATHLNGTLVSGSLDKGRDRDVGKELITVRGVVAPSEWDMRDEVTAVTLFALDETEFVVNARYMVKRLMKYMDEEVEAHGFISTDEYGSEVFIVSDFTPVEAGEEEGDEDEGEWVEDADLDAEDWEDTADTADEDDVWADGGGAEGESDAWKRRRHR